MHDVKLFTGDLASLNFVGVRTWEGSPKRAWNVVKNFGF
jgi:hypothetical protein